MRNVGGKMRKYERSKKASTSKGMGLLDTLTLIFMVLKMAGLVNWSWWFVFSPTIIGLGLLVLVILIVYAVEVINAKRGY